MAGIAASSTPMTPAQLMARIKASGGYEDQTEVIVGMFHHIALLALAAENAGIDLFDASYDLIEVFDPDDNSTPDLKDLQ